MKVKKHLSELVDVPRMDVDKEGLLLGGFVMLGPPDDDEEDEEEEKVVNGNCDCNSDILGGCKGNENCVCNNPCKVNMDCNCDCKGTTSPVERVTPTLPVCPVSPMIGGFGFFF